MTKQKISLVLALALLAVTASVASQPIWADNDGLNNTSLTNTNANGMGNEGAAAAEDTTTVSVTYNYDKDSFERKAYVTTDLTVGFPMEAATTNGAVRVLIPTATASATATGGAPAVDAFIVPDGDLDNKVTVTCPQPVTGADGQQVTFGTPTKSVILYDTQTGAYTAAIDLNDSTPDGTTGRYIRYLAFTCPYTGTPSRSGAYEITDYDGVNSTTGNNHGAYNVVVKNLINPGVPQSAYNHQNNAAPPNINDALTIPGRVQIFDTQTAVAGTESEHMMSDMDVLISAIMQDVLVTAKVEYQLMFRVDGVKKGTKTMCGDTGSLSAPRNDGVVTDVDSTSLLIDYGTPTVGQQVNAAQQIYVNSSVDGGYKVTVSQDRNMRRQDIFNSLPTEDQSEYYNKTLCYTDQGMVADTTAGKAGTINRDCIPNFGWDDTRTAGGLTPSKSMAWGNSNSTDKTLNHVINSTATGLGYTVAVAKNTAGSTTDSLGRVINQPTVNKMFYVAGDAADGTYGNIGGKYYTRLATRTASGAVGSLTSAAGSYEEPVAIAASSGLTSGDLYDVCYRLVIDANNNAGVYDNSVTYTITASL